MPFKTVLPTQSTAFSSSRIPALSWTKDQNSYDGAIHSWRLDTKYRGDCHCEIKIQKNNLNSFSVIVQREVWQNDTYLSRERLVGRFATQTQAVKTAITTQQSIEQEFSLVSPAFAPILKPALIGPRYRQSLHFLTNENNNKIRAPEKLLPEFQKEPSLSFIKEFSDCIYINTIDFIGLAEWKEEPIRQQTGISTHRFVSTFGQFNLCCINHPVVDFDNPLYETWGTHPVLGTFYFSGASGPHKLPALSQSAPT
jgi:hypothetical protein